MCAVVWLCGCVVVWLGVYVVVCARARVCWFLRVPLLPYLSRYGKSVIHTCCQLDYRTAQDMLDGAIRVDPATGECLGLELWEEHRRPTGTHAMADVIADVKSLNVIAQRRRGLRMQAGAFKITTKQLSFRLDPQTRLPQSAGAYVALPPSLAASVSPRLGWPGLAWPGLT